MRQRLLQAARVAAVVTGILGAGISFASPVVTTATLLGDPRVGNPDNLRIDVTINWDNATSIATWTVDINSPLHPNAKLDEFYFNMGGAAGTYSFSNEVPAGWVVSTSGGTNGGGGISFMFEAADPAGQPNAANVTNTQDLTFTMTKSGGSFTAADFSGAALSCSNDTTLGCGQLGAHLQSLTVPAGSTGVSDSGFLLGNYDRPNPPQEVPIPAAAWLLGSGLMAMGAIGRRRIKGMA